LHEQNSKMQRSRQENTSKICVSFGAMKSHCRRSATALDQALSMDGYPHSSTLLDTKNVSKRIKPSIIVCGPCTCPLHGLPFAHPEGQRRHRQHVTADGTAQCLLSGHEGGRIEHFLRGQMLRGRLRSALKLLKHQVKGPKGKQLTRSRYFQVLYSLYSWHAAKTSVVSCWRCGKPFWRQEVNRLGDKWCDKREDRRR
jgi:hypothetical protein